MINNESNHSRAVSLRLRMHADMDLASQGQLLNSIFALSLGKRMSQVTVGENEGIESALRRFKRSVAKAGIFSDLRRIRHHETPVEKYKRKLKQRSRNRRR